MSEVDEDEFETVNSRNILPDTKLAKLLKLGKEDKLSYFNLQRFMKIHFIKAVPAAPVV